MIMTIRCCGHCRGDFEKALQGLACPLRTSIRRAKITFIAQLSPASIAPKSRLRRPAMTTVPGAHVVPVEPAPLPELAAADRGVASSLEVVLSDNTRRTYGAQWRIFDGWCAEVGLSALPAEPLNVARYLAARAGSGASVATPRWPPPPSRKPTSGRSWNRPAGTRACAPL